VLLNIGLDNNCDHRNDGRIDLFKTSRGLLKVFVKNYFYVWDYKNTNLYCSDFMTICELFEQSFFFDCNKSFSRPKDCKPYSMASSFMHTTHSFCRYF
jgi:hypothetical protein